MLTRFHDVNMASNWENSKSQLSHCFRAEIILKNKDDDSMLLWRCKDGSQWQLPGFLLNENESFREGIETWCTEQLVSL